MVDAVVLWKKCLNDLEYQVKGSIFTMWLRPLTAEVNKNTLIVKAPNDIFVEYIIDNFLEIITQLASKHSTNQIDSVSVIDIRKDSLSKVVSNNDSNQLNIQESSIVLTNKKSKSLNIIDPNFTFDTFVTGKSNNLAYKACYELTKKNPQNRHNPLFIYGPSGLGKTHLMHSVAHKYLKSNRTFYYFTSDKFVNQMVNSLRQKKIDEFKKKIKQVDLLIIDDIHVLAGKTKTITEFLSLFADFTSGDKQIILASDRHPAQLNEFDERFRSRLSGGLSVAIDPPELDTRVQILQKKASLSDIELPKDCALFIAQNVVSNVRRLEGALNQVIANASLTGVTIDLEMVQYALRDIIVQRFQSVSMDNIRKVVAEFYDVSVKDLMGKKRTRSIARPRQIAMALARELTGDSYPEIGQSFGGRDHSTVMHACDKVKKLRAEDLILDKEYKALAMMLQAG
ncbi:MAG: chromosomal replication initiator protein DnaA [Gammaproteobacteria bacterium]|nr:MAG: chromosomal replication initiator protein DnaA [Gammaproteobacteria bacterium]